MPQLLLNWLSTGRPRRDSRMNMAKRRCSTMQHCSKIRAAAGWSVANDPPGTVAKLGREQDNQDQAKRQSRIE